MTWPERNTGSSVPDSLREVRWFFNVPVNHFREEKGDGAYAQDEITCFRISETWRKHATPCFRYVYVKVVRFRCIRSNGNARKRHETGKGNTGYPSCFRNGLTRFYHVSVYGFLQFRPVTAYRSYPKRTVVKAKVGTFSSIFYDPECWPGLELEPSTSSTPVERSKTWANQARLVKVSKEDSISFIMITFLFVFLQEIFWELYFHT